MNKLALILFTLFTLGFHLTFAATPKVGKKAAARYFQGENQSQNQSGTESQLPPVSRSTSSIDSVPPEGHYLTIGFSNYLNSDSYSWGPTGEEKIGKWGVDMMYRLGLYSNTIDQALRVSYNEYEVQNQRTSKMSFLYAITLPDAGSQFPLYFGVAFGPGIFLKQIPNESSLSLDYQLYAGLRLFNIMDNAGFYVEGGLKNHLLLTSDGQLNGTFISAGAVFAF